jgi:4-deoxy-L-threo-5-hexosulose-uronate ketol-isomerase
MTVNATTMGAAMKIRQMADEVRYASMSTAALRDTFLFDDLFAPGVIAFHYVDLDRTVIGSAVPAGEALTLPTYDPLKASYFTERRELGVLNIGGEGSVSVGGLEYQLARLDALYIGRGNESISFSSDHAANPAEFYLLSYPAHAAHPIQLVRSADLEPVKIGSAETANAREITKLMSLENVRSCQLVMGFTQLASGSVWNTMPPHTHMRRSEVYLYFNIEESERVMHLMGPASETRHILVADKQVVVSPGWSIHAGVGTRNYAFCWGMGGENQVYSDMDALTVADLS